MSDLNKSLSIILLSVLVMITNTSFAQISDCDKCTVTKVKKKHRKMYTEVIINSPKMEAWKVLTDFEKMPEWSTGLQSIQGEIKNGGKARAYFMSKKGELNSYEKDSLIYVEGEMFGWQSPFVLGIKDNHSYKLESVSATQTKIIHTDECIRGGLMAGLFHKKIAYRLLDAMNKFNNELKTRVENE